MPETDRKYFLNLCENYQVLTATQWAIRYRLRCPCSSQNQTCALFSSLSLSSTSSCAEWMRIFLIFFFLLNICRHCGICSEIRTHFNIKKEESTSPMLCVSFLVWFVDFLFSFYLRWICTGNVITQNMAFGILGIDGMSLNFCWIWYSVRCVCVRYRCFGLRRRTTSAHNMRGTIYWNGMARKRKMRSLCRTWWCVGGAVVTKVEFITSNRERNAIPEAMLLLRGGC